MTARARRYDLLQSELAADDRAEIRARGGIAPHPDGTARTVIERFGPVNGLYRARCSCGFDGGTWLYVGARDEARAHECAP